MDAGDSPASVARWIYVGGFQFPKHYYAQPGDMNSEEARCAAVIDSLDEVKFWVRNLERQPSHSFWLQTPTDKFYPDFVAMLHDGRFLVVEYKGAYLMGAPDTVEKARIGELWQARSNGRCIFSLVSDEDFESRIRQAVAGPRSADSVNA